MHTYSNCVNLLEMLSLLKSKAIRSRVWYRALSINERVLVGLVTRYIKKVRNKQLAIVLARVVVRLSIAVDRFIRVEQLGFARAYAWLKGMLLNGVSDGIVEYILLHEGRGSDNSISIIPVPGKAIVTWFTTLEMNMLRRQYYY